MNTLESEVEVSADGSLKLLGPLPAWLKPGRMHMFLAASDISPLPTKRRVPPASPEMVEQRKAALARLQTMGGLKDVIPDPAAWQREIRSDVQMPGRE